MILLFLGASGSGKDTQAEFLEREYGFINISSGQLIKQYLAEGKELGIKAKDYVMQGQLVPDEIVYAILEDYMKSINQKNIILNGVLRSETQVEFLDNLLKNLNLNLDKAVYFNLGLEEAIKRLSGRWIAPTSGKIYHEVYNPPKTPGIDDETGEALIQREDDKPEAIRNRIQFYVDHIQQIIKEYNKREILITIDASKSIEDINKDLIEKLNLENEKTN